MCGIAGIWNPRADVSECDLTNLTHAMSEAVRHRGPDRGGSWVDVERGVGLGFRRLAILDLTSSGDQPMTSQCSRYVVVFNGEIYNHSELRRELDAGFFRGHSDTEVMLAAFSRWGVREATKRFNGMFAFAAWDRERHSLILGRDRMGEKPLYYGTCSGNFFFGSELKALRAGPGFDPDINREAITLFMRHGCIPAPRTVYEGIHKLLPGTLVEVEAGVPGGPVPYWSAGAAAIEGLQNPLQGTEREEADELHQRLYRAVGMRMEADVPLGAFLSGGIDSSLVVALMQAQSTKAVRTFSIGFDESAYDEAPFAKLVAAHLGTEHTEMYVTPDEAREVVPLLATMYDEPFADSSQIPTYLVSKMARRDVTVSLSGDGGDELFGGYSRYLLLNRLWARLRLLPKPLRSIAAHSLRAIPPNRWDSMFHAAAPILPSRLRHSHPGDKVHKLAGGLQKSNAGEVYLQLVSLWQDPAGLVIGGNEPTTLLTRGGDEGSWRPPAVRAMYLDSVTYLPDDILVKVDRAAMAVSLETRVPLLDHTLYEYAWRLPSDLRIRGGVGKYLLKQVLARYVPTALIDRPKMGFGVPIGDWMRGPLRAWAEDLLSVEHIRRHGLLRPEPVRAAWEGHVAGDVDLKYQLWPILMLQAWQDQAAASP